MTKGMIRWKANASCSTEGFMVRAILSLVQHFRCHVHTVCVKVPHPNLADDRVLIAHACLISHHSDSEAVAKLPKASGAETPAPDHQNGQTHARECQPCVKDSTVLGYFAPHI